MEGLHAEVIGSRAGRTYDGCVDAPASAEIVRKESPYPVVETIDRLEAIIKERNLTVVARVDHAAGAKRANLDNFVRRS